jgi:hypothetical protein
MAVRRVSESSGVCRRKGAQIGPGRRRQGNRLPRAIGANTEYAHIVFYRTSKEILPTTNSARWSPRAPTTGTMGYENLPLGGSRKFHFPPAAKFTPERSQNDSVALGRPGDEIERRASGVGCTQRNRHLSYKNRHSPPSAELTRKAKRTHLSDCERWGTRKIAAREHRKADSSLRFASFGMTA